MVVTLSVVTAIAQTLTTEASARHTFLPSAAPVNLCPPVAADTPTRCGVSATASVSLGRWQNEYECENSMTTKVNDWCGSCAGGAPDRW